MHHRAEGPPLLLPLLLVACTWVSVLSTDLYAPSLPHLADLLGTTHEAVKLTMAANLVAFAVAQLVHAPLSDRFGPRALLVTGMVLFSIASASCALAPSIEALIGGRFAQGLFSSVPSVVVLLLIHELYGPGRAVRVLGFHGMAVCAAPIVGPLIGGYVFVAFGWRANFLVLVLVSITVAVLVSRYVPEGRVKSERLSISATMRSYAAVLNSRIAIGHLLPPMATWGILFAFVTSGPFLLIDLYGVPTERYGLYFGVIVLGAVAGGIFASRLGEAIEAHVLKSVAYAMTCASVLSLAAVSAAGYDNAVSVTACMTLFGAAVGLMNASAPLLLMDSVDDAHRSAASALSGSSQLAAASVASLAVSAFRDTTPTPMIAVMLALLVFGGAGFLLGPEKRVADVR